MHTMRKSEPDLWTVGYYRPESGEWMPLKDFSTQTDAAKWVNYLNGGNSTVDCYMVQP